MFLQYAIILKNLGKIQYILNKVIYTYICFYSMQLFWKILCQFILIGEIPVAQNIQIKVEIYFHLYLIFL